MTDLTSLGHSASARQLMAARVCLDNQIAFAIFTKPDDEAVTFLCDDNDESTVKSGQTFFITRYLARFDSRVIIRDTLSDEDVIKKFGDKKRSSNDKSDKIPSSTSKADYIAGVSKVIERLKSDGGKTVISKLIAADKRIDILKAAEKVFELNPHAFRALFYTPETGCWLVASPERLMSFNLYSHTFETMSLAGTRPVSTVDKPWDLKNIAEQKMVTDYIDDTLNVLGFSDIKSQAKTLKSNNVEHICTTFSGTFTDRSMFGQCVDTLSPTPALAGSPRDVAVKEISRTELHDRDLYSGYIGIENDNEISAYVTLRCARIYPDGYCIYSGGGITAQSNAEDEWKETELKAASLRKIFDSAEVQQQH
jgi:isochorismate synthase